MQGKVVKADYLKIFMAKTEHYFTKFEEGKFYHVYNRAVDRQLLFKSIENYSYFLKRFDFYLSDIVQVYANSLLDNHFHFLIKVVDDLQQFKKLKQIKIELSNHEIVSKQFRLFFQSYAISFNNQHNRVGALFQTPFKRVLIDDDSHLTHLIFYIHSNPQKHNLIDDFVKWRWSSYARLISDAETKLFRKEVMELFGGNSQFIDFHSANCEILNEKYIID